jgi:hypothetical protein
VTSADKRPLRAGDVVEVRSAAEILATLDRGAALGKMPFMPEMLRYAGQRFEVSSRVDKICDTVASTGSRRMQDTVFLEDLRCDGSRHGGCQQGCRLYWNEAWVRRVDDQSKAVVVQKPAHESAEATVRLEQLAEAGTRTVREIEGKPSEVWRCQVTESFVATTQANRPRQSPSIFSPAISCR